MRLLIAAVSAALALAPFAAQAAAPAGGATADVRCLMTMAALTNSPNANQAKLAQLGVVYFAGRVKAQDPSYNFGSRLKTVAATLDRATLTAEAQRCGPMLTASLRELDEAQKAFTPPKAAAAKPAAKAGAAPAK